MKAMARSKGKRFYHRQDMDKVNRVALYVGGIAACLLVVVMIFSLLRG